MEFGFLRETEEIARKAGLDEETGIIRTGLEKYLEVIFPNIDDWVHDKVLPVEIDGQKCKKRPDYRSEKLKMIIEFNGLPHFQKPDVILNDEVKIKFYESLGYKVISIPYCIQLTNEIVKKIFGVKVSQALFPNDISSLSPKCRNTPAYLCPLGIKKMAQIYNEFQDQFIINKNKLIQYNDNLTGLSYLEKEMKVLKNSISKNKTI